MTVPALGLLDPLGQGGPADDLLGDAAWLQAMVDVELALTRSLVEAGVAPEWMSDVASALAHATDLDGAAIAAAGRSGGNPVIPLVGQLGALAEKQHEGASDHLHVGATSQDILDSAAMLVASRAIARIDDDLVQLATTLSEFARLHRSTPMPGRTLGQHASPTSFGLVVAGWLDGILGARQRLRSIVLPLQFGGSVGTRAVLTAVIGARGSSASVDGVLADTAHRLGLQPSSPWHTNRLPIVELGSALAAVVGAVGAMAVDVGVLSRTEIAEVSERLGSGEGGSSAMPHKRNPVSSVLLVSAARRSPALVATLFDAQVAEDQRPSGAWHSEWQALRELETLAVDAAFTGASLASRLEVDVERMRSNLDFTDGLIYSEAVTTALAGTLGKAVAFDLVEQASREAVQTHRPLQVVVSARLAGGEFTDGLRSAVWAAFDPEHAIASAGAMIDSVIARVKELA